MTRTPIKATDARQEVVSLGCRLNLAEGEAVKRALKENAAGDIGVINTCAVTNEAVRRSRQQIRRMRRNAPDRPLFVTGCAAQIDPESFADMAEVDGVIGNDVKSDPTAWRDLLAMEPGEGAVRVNDIMSVRTTAPQFVEGYGERARAFIQVQNGCDHRCTFCIIPYGRGNARSAPIENIVPQAKALVEAGHAELVITGVDITSWGSDLDGTPVLGDLVSAILDAVPDLRRLRLSSIDGAEIDPLLHDLIASDARIAPHIHLSVQSGDDMILKRMKRRHNRQDIIQLCTDLRNKRPGIAFGADIIAGFPTESDEMFENSLKLIDDAGLNYLHIFPFSPRKGTPAARMPQMDKAVIKERAAKLRQAGVRAEEMFFKQLIGTVDDAILETGGVARLGNFAPVQLAKPDGAQPGTMVKIRVAAYREGVLMGAPVRAISAAAS